MVTARLSMQLRGISVSSGSQSLLGSFAKPRGLLNAKLCWDLLVLQRGSCCWDSCWAWGVQLWLTGATSGDDHFPHGQTSWTTPCPVSKESVELFEWLLQQQCPENSLIVTKFIAHTTRNVHAQPNVASKTPPLLNLNPSSAGNVFSTGTNLVLNMSW